MKGNASTKIYTEKGRANHDRVFSKPQLPNDVSRCPGDDCPVKGNCKRYLAGLNGGRVWGKTQWDNVALDCEFYLRERG